MAGAANTIDRIYHQPLWGRTDLALRRSLIGSASLGALALLAVFVAPSLPPATVTIEQMPERIARLILEKPSAPTPTRAPAARSEKPAVEAPAPTTVAEAAPPRPAAKPKAKPKAKPRPTTAPRRRAEPPRVAADQGAQGRQKAAAEVTANLSRVSQSLDKALGDLAQAIPAARGQGADAADKPRGRPRRGVRAGRSGGDLTQVQGSANVATADLGGSAIGGEAISIAAITDLAWDGADDGATGQGREALAGAGQPARSNESLLAVVRRYAPGIQYCYENELKRNPGLRGKLVVSLTVDAAGRVTEATLAEDSLGAAAVSQCALAQIRDWKFPPAAAGVTTFRTPFVFTPPK